MRSIHLSGVVPANAGTHTAQYPKQAGGQYRARQSNPVSMGPASARYALARGDIYAWILQLRI